VRSKLGSPSLLPPFLVGAALAVVAEVAAGLLLYGGPGFIPALSVILAVVLLSLGVGLWQGGTGKGEDPVEIARRRWLLALVSVAAAAVFSGLWEIFQGFGAAALTQGLGLAFLAALPMYAGGLLLAGLGGIGTGDGSPRAGAAALAGAGMGVLVAGHLFFPTLSPTAILLLCLMALSAAALLHGRILDRQVSVQGIRVLGGGRARVQVEEWVRGHPSLLRSVLLTPRGPRVITDEQGQAVLPDEILLEEGVPAWTGTVRRALVLGGGGGAVARRLARHDEREVWLVDGNGALLEAVVGALPGGDASTLHTHRVRVSDLLLGDAGPPAEGPFDLIVLEWTRDTVPGALDRLPAPALERLRALLGPAGVLVIFPLTPDPERGEEGLLTLARTVNRDLSRTALYVARTDPGALAQVPVERQEAWLASRPAPGERGAVLVAGTTTGRPWPERIREFLLVPVEGAEEAADAPGPSL